jgi:hypothetical protein
MAAANNTAPLVPEERFWKRYSAHHELPLAGITSLFLHGIVLAFLVLGGLAFFFSARDEASRPPSMDVVQIEGSGDGNAEGAAGTPGETGDTGKSEEVVPNAATPLQPFEAATPLEFKDAPTLKLEVPTEALPKDSTDIAQLLKDVGETAKKQVQQADAAKPSSPPKRIAMQGKGKGTDGKSGTGAGRGAGLKGTGPGSGSGSGRIATQAEIYALRWRFDLTSTGGGLRHADKLAAVGFVVAFPDAKGRYRVVQDLRRRPVELKTVDEDVYKDAVKWKSERPESVHALKQELKLKINPAFTIIMVPKELEQRMADEEARFAQKASRDLHAVKLTSFDFRLQDGRYEPVVMRQE